MVVERHNTFKRMIHVIFYRAKMMESVIYVIVVSPSMDGFGQHFGK